MIASRLVTPAQAGVQPRVRNLARWMPAYAGVTIRDDR